MALPSALRGWWRKPWMLTWRVAGQISQDDVLGTAAGVAYYLVLALFPLLIALTALLGVMAGVGSQLRADLLGYLDRVVPPSASSLIHTTLDEIVAGSGGGKLSLGLLATLWAASNGMLAIMNALNRAYGVEEARPWWKARLVSIGLTVALLLLAPLGVAALVYGGRLGEALDSRLGLTVAATVWNALYWPLALVLVLGLLSFVYYWAPCVEVRRWRWVVPGAVLSMGLWLAVSFGLRLYLSFFDTYSRTYGSLGAVVVLLLWLYLTGVAIMLGGELNSELEHAAAEEGDPNAKAFGEACPGELRNADGTCRDPEEEAAPTS